VLIRSLLAATAVAGCGGAGEETPGGAGAPAGSLTEYRPCAADRRIGEFKIQVAPDFPDLPQFTSVEGAVRDGVNPAKVPQVVRQAGECRVLRAQNLFCDPACRSGQTCGPGGKCVAEPVRKSVGTVTVTGLKVAVVMKHSAGTNYANPESLPHPALDEGADIRLEASGGDLPRFALRGKGIGALKPLGKELLVESGKPLKVAWAPPGKAGPQRVRVELNLNHHGGTPSWVACDVPDTGSYDIPAALVTELRGLEVTGFPTIIVNRQTADSAAVASGCVELAVSSEIELNVKIPGQHDCKIDDDCPAGRKCDSAKQICQ
jgi:hypothetical protein